MYPPYKNKQKYIQTFVKFCFGNRKKIVNKTKQYVVQSYLELVTPYTTYPIITSQTPFSDHVLYRPQPHSS